MKQTLLSIKPGSKPVAESASRAYSKKPRGWQAKGFERLKNADNILIEAPTGAGKSVLAEAIMTYRHKQDPKARSIVLVPQRAITLAFDKTKIEGVGIWNPTNTTLDTKPIKKQMADWIKSNSRALVCTSSGFLRYWDTFREELQQFSLTLWIDEAHHLEYFEDEKDKARFVNKTGNLLNEALAGGIRVGISSATMFRGDKSLVINPHLRSLFTCHRYEFSEYIEGFQHIKDIRYCVETYVNSPTERISEHFRSTKATNSRGTAIYLPMPTSREGREWLKGKKGKQVEEILKELGPLKEEGKGTSLYGTTLVTDLVSNEHLQEKEQTTTEGDTDVLIAMKRFKEGTNWLEAVTAIIIGRRRSLVEIAQILGRLLRDHPSKTKIEIKQLLPAKVLDTKRLKGNVEEYLRTLCGALLIRELLRPKRGALQKHGAETTAKVLSATCTALVKHSKSSAPEMAKHVRMDVKKILQRSRPDLSDAEQEEIMEEVERTVTQAITATVNGGNLDEEYLKDPKATQDIIRPAGPVFAKESNITLIERVNRIGKARRAIRILSVNLFGETAKEFVSDLGDICEEKLLLIREQANDQNITSLYAWKKKYAIADDSFKNPERIPGWDSWETTTDSNLPYASWPKLFTNLVENKSLLQQISKYRGSLPLSSKASKQRRAFIAWLDRQRKELNNNSLQTEPLAQLLASLNIQTIGPVIDPKNFNAELFDWLDAFGPYGLNVEPKLLLNSYKDLLPTRKLPKIPKIRPEIEALTLEEYWAKTSQLPEDKLSALWGQALKVRRQSTPRERAGISKYLQAIALQEKTFNEK